MDILKVVRNLLIQISDVPSNDIWLARANYLEQDFKSNIVVIDSLLNTPLGRQNEYDGDNEQMTYRTYRSSQITIDTYGSDAETNINQIEALLDGQTSHEFCRDNDIEVFNNKTIQNLKYVQGKTVYNRFQLEIVVKYNQQISEEILRIDTAQLEVYTDSGKRYDVDVDIT